MLLLLSPLLALFSLCRLFLAIDIDLTGTVRDPRQIRDTRWLQVRIYGLTSTEMRTYNGSAQIQYLLVWPGGGGAGAWEGAPSLLGVAPSPAPACAASRSGLWCCCPCPSGSPASLPPSLSWVLLVITRSPVHAPFLTKAYSYFIESVHV